MASISNRSSAPWSPTEESDLTVELAFESRVRGVARVGVGMRVAYWAIWGSRDAIGHVCAVISITPFIPVGPCRIIVTP